MSDYLGSPARRKWKDGLRSHLYPLRKLCQNLEIGLLCAS